jgi:hypothetical protein
MHGNPIHTVFQVLGCNLPDQISSGGFRWFEVALYLVLLIGSLAIAYPNWRLDATRRNGARLSIYALRLASAGMWYPGTLWKLPLPGIAVRLAGIVGVLFIPNLLIDLYNDPTEWPWAYVGIICARGIFAVAQTGRSLGIDNLLAKRLIPGLPHDGTVACAIAVAAPRAIAVAT